MENGNENKEVKRRSSEGIKSQQAPPSNMIKNLDKENISLRNLLMEIIEECYKSRGSVNDLGCIRRGIKGYTECEEKEDLQSFDEIASQSMHVQLSYIRRLLSSSNNEFNEHLQEIGHTIG
jgi:hypothetical protein